MPPTRPATPRLRVGTATGAAARSRSAAAAARRPAPPDPVWTTRTGARGSGDRRVGTLTASPRRRPHEHSPIPPSSPATSLPTRPAPPPRPRASAALVVLAVLAVGYTLWAAQDLLLPVLLAMFFALVGNPIIRVLRRLWSRASSARCWCWSCGIAGDRACWASSWSCRPATGCRRCPRELRDADAEAAQLTKPMQEANQAAENIARAAGGESAASRCRWSAPRSTIRTSR